MRPSPHREWWTRQRRTLVVGTRLGRRRRCPSMSSGGHPALTGPAPTYGAWRVPGSVCRHRGSVGHSHLSLPGASVWASDWPLAVASPSKGQTRGSFQNTSGAGSPPNPELLPIARLPWADPTLDVPPRDKQVSLTTAPSAFSSLPGSDAPGPQLGVCHGSAFTAVWQQGPARILERGR